VPEQRVNIVLVVKLEHGLDLPAKPAELKRDFRRLFLETGEGARGEVPALTEIRLLHYRIKILQVTNQPMQAPGCHLTDVQLAGKLRPAIIFNNVHSNSPGLTGLMLSLTLPHV
jgi:hypothetical protein